MKSHPLPWLGLVLAAIVLHTPIVIHAADLPAKPSADPYPIGARVEVRRNNQWLPATIVKRDGTKAFVKFDGATDSFNEWVEGTQIREASVVTATGPTTLPAGLQPGKPATKAAPDPFAVGAEIEAIFQGHWTDATVLSRTGTKAEVIFMNAFKETVDSTKMRVRGVSPEEAAKLTSQGGLFRAGANIEYKWGNRWYDGVITRRNETEIEVKTSDGFTHRAIASDLRTRAVAPPLPPQPGAAGAAPPPANPAASAATPAQTAATPASTKFPVGTLIEYPFGNSNWFDGVVASQDGATIKITNKVGMEESHVAGQLRLRGVPIIQLTAEKQTECLRAGAKVETTNGSWWSDGTVSRREARRVEVRGEHGFAEWHDFENVRSREFTAAAGAPVAGTPATQPANPLAPNWAGARQIAFAQPPAGWTVAPDPATQPANPALVAPAAPDHPMLVPLPPMAATAGTQNALWQFVAHMIVPSGSNTGLIIHAQEGPRDIPFITQVEKLDLATGMLWPSIAMPQGLLPIDMSADGKRVLLAGHASRTRSVVEVWSIESKPGLPLPSRVKVIQPFISSNGTEEEISATAFIDADHLLCASGRGLLAMIDVPQMKVIWSVQTPVPLRRIGLSPGRHQVAVPSELGVFLLDPMTGDILGLLGSGSSINGEMPIRFMGRGRSLRDYAGTGYGGNDMRFRPDGKRLLSMSDRRLSAWDIDTGNLWRSFDTPKGASNAEWVGDNHVMLDGSRLLDLEHRIVVWTYQFPNLQNKNPVTGAGGGKFWYLVSEAPSAPAKVVHRQLAGISFPPKSVVDAVNALPPQQLYSWYPGMSVSLSINVGGDLQEKVTQSITLALQGRGMKIADGQPVRVEASTSSGESKSVTYQKTVWGQFGPPSHETETVTITPTISRIAIIDASGKTLWETSSTSGGYAPGMISIKQGQTAQQTIDEQHKPNAGFFTSCPFPEYVVLPRETEGIGQSALTIKGIETPPPAAP